MTLHTKNFLCVGIGMIFLSACSDKVQEIEEIVRPVKFQTISNAGSYPSLKFTGVTRADVEIKLSFRVAGSLVFLNALDGKIIKKGEMIAALDDSDVKLKYERQKAVLKNSKVKMETAGSSLSRIKGLYENDNVPLGEYESAKEKNSNAVASFNAEQRATDLLKRELGYYRLYTPADGVVLASDVSKNENIQTGQVIAVIQSGKALAVKVGLPEQLITNIKVGQSAEIQFSSISGTSFSGVVSEVAYTVNQDSSVYPVTVIIKDPSKKIRPGMPANVSFVFESDNSRANVVIPLHSVVKDDSGNYVLLVVESEAGYGIVHKTPVTIGRMTSDGFEVVSGVNIGDNVITAGISNLVDGMRVRFIN